MATKAKVGLRIWAASVMIFVMLVTCTGLTFAADDSSKSSKPKTKAESKSGEKKKESGKKSGGGMGYGGARRSK